MICKLVRNDCINLQSKAICITFQRTKICSRVVDEFTPTPHISNWRLFLHALPSTDEEKDLQEAIVKYLFRKWCWYWGGLQIGFDSILNKKAILLGSYWWLYYVPRGAAFLKEILNCLGDCGRVKIINFFICSLHWASKCIREKTVEVLE